MFGFVSEDRILAELKQGLVTRSINDWWVSDEIFELVIGVNESNIRYVFGFDLIFGLLFFQNFLI